ncbi:MAG: alpha/beta fold hydrolase [Candidatus Hodarchaeota archaeon]
MSKFRDFFRPFYSETPPILGEDGNEKPNSITSMEFIKLGGIEQWIIIRSHNINNPLLLLLHGGPGSVESPLSYKFQRELEKSFIVVNWDQRGGGKSYSKKISKESMNIEQFITDAHDLIQLLKKRFKKEKIYIVGHSWGSILGTLLVQHYPELFYAYIGVGQVVNIVDNEIFSFQYTLEEAKKRGNKKALKQLEKIRPYTGENLKHLKIQRKWLKKFGGVLHNQKSMWSLIKVGMRSPEYKLGDFIKFIKGINFSIKYLWGTLFSIDFLKDVKELEVPVYFCVGRYDYNAPFELSERFFKKLRAPMKKYIWFENSAHCPNFEEPDKYQNFLITEVLPETYNR